ncbi:Helicase associated domain protein [Kitasatospora purpeofusca]|nr:Helicase associated domain protein [Kitasatospora purpeofusca]
MRASAVTREGPLAAPRHGGLRSPLRGHQDLAVDSCVSVFKEGASRATITMATGSGKTHVALNTVHEVAPNGRALVVVPSLRLLEQTAALWHHEGRPGRYIGVCSRDTPADPTLAGILTTTDKSEELAALSAQSDGPLNVFCTYQSLDKVTQAHAALHLPGWDVIVVDEAHHTTGNLDKAWAQVHDNDVLPARHRLYMTATPLVFDRQKGTERGVPPDRVVASMDDHSLYGPTVYSISLARSIDQGLLADYRIVVITIRNEDLLHALRRDTSTWTSEALRTAAAQLALTLAQQRYDLRRTLTFHPSIAAAKTFADTLPGTAALRPGFDRFLLHVGTVNSHQTPFEQHQAYAAFATTPLNTVPSTAAPHRAVLTNCRCCSEGVDIPAIDSVLFAHPKTSTVDIVQAVGRALRQTPGDGKISTIVIPIYLAPGDDMGEATRRTPWRLLYEVLIALSLYDEHTFHRVEHLEAHRLGESALPELAAAPERADEILQFLDLSDTPAPNQLWDYGFASAERFRRAHGHLNVPSRYLGPDRFYLGWWIGQQRSLRLNAMLLPDRISTLDTLGMLWEHPPRSIERKLQVARDYMSRNGHLALAEHERHGGLHLGRWLADRRREVRDRTLPVCYQRALGEIYPWWSEPWPPAWKRTYAQALAAARKGDLAFPTLRPQSDHDPLTRWLDDQIDNLAKLGDTRHNLLGALPFTHPLALLLRRPRGAAEWAFARGLRAARTFRRNHQHLDVPSWYRCALDGTDFQLGRWISERRRDPGALSREQLDALEALNMRWTSRWRPRTG